CLFGAAEISSFYTLSLHDALPIYVGDVSWVVPTVGLRVATWVPGTSAHSWQAVAAGGTSIGTRGMIVAAKTMTLTALDLYRDQADRKSTRLNSSHVKISYAVFCLK